MKKGRRSTKKAVLKKTTAKKPSKSKPPKPSVRKTVPSRRQSDLTLRENVKELELKLSKMLKRNRAMREQINNIIEMVTAQAESIDKLTADLNQQKHATDNLFKAVDSIPESRVPRERSSLGRLIDQGGAIPVNSDAVGVFKRK